MKRGRKSGVGGGGPAAEGEVDRAGLPPVKKGLTISAEADYRLQAAAVHTGRDQSELVEELILRHLGGFFTSVRKPAGETAGPGESSPLKLSG